MNDEIEKYIKETKKDIDEIMSLLGTIHKTQSLLYVKLKEVARKTNPIEFASRRSPQVLQTELQKAIKKQDRAAMLEDKKSDGFCIHCNLLIIGEYGYMVSKQDPKHCQECYDKYHSKEK